MRKNLDDNDVLKKLRQLRRAGRTHVRAGEIARIFSVDSVRALGAMLRVNKRLRKNYVTVRSLKDYSITVRWEKRAKYFVAEIQCLPFFAADGPTPAKAVANLEDTFKTLKAAYAEGYAGVG